MAYQSDPHAAHDLVLIASITDGETGGPEHERAWNLVASCTDCAALHADLLVIASATRGLPPIPRTRDFSLTPADATRLRPAGWRRLLEGLGGSRDALSRPLALGLTTLGLAGILVASVPSFFVGGAPSQSVGGAPAIGAPAAAPPEALDSATDDGTVFSGADPGSSPDIQAEGAPDAAIPAPGEGQSRAARDADLLPDAASGPAPLIAISAVSLVLGLGLFALRWRTRRLGED